MPTAGEDYDIVINDGAASPSTIQGLMVVRDENGQLSLIEDVLPPVQSPVPRDTVSYAQLPPDQELVWAQRSWHNGFGKFYYDESDPFRYLEAKGVDARFANRLNLAPMYRRDGPLFADLSLEGWQTTSTLLSWVESAPNAVTITRETGAANVHEGTSSAKIVTSGGDTGFISQQNTVVTKLAGEEVTFGAWVKQSVADSVRILIIDNNGTTTGGDSGDTTNEWINITATRTLHATTTHVTFKIEVYVDATVYVDQLFVKVGGETGEDQNTVIANLDKDPYFNLGPYIFRQNDVSIALSSGRPSFPSTKAGADVTDLVVYGDNLYAALGGTAYIYSADPEHETGPTYTSSNLGDPDGLANRFGVSPNANGELALWKAKDGTSLNASVSPTNTGGIYGITETVGHDDGVFTRTYNFAGALVVAKTDGVYMYRRTTDDINPVSYTHLTLPTIYSV